MKMQSERRKRGSKRKIASVFEGRKMKRRWRWRSQWPRSEWGKERRRRRWWRWRRRRRKDEKED